jgi:hypothetical protein
LAELGFAWLGLPRRLGFGAALAWGWRRAYLSNDRRSELKRDINALLGSKLRVEKFYGPY